MKNLIITKNVCSFFVNLQDMIHKIRKCTIKLFLIPKKKKIKNKYLIQLHYKL